MYLNSVYERPLSSRACTDSFCSITFTVKCLPTSRRKSTRRCSTSQSALLTTSAPVSRASKSRNRCIWSRMRCRCSRICSFDSSGRSVRLPPGSPMRPGPPPIPTMRRWFTRRRVAVATLLGGAYGFGLAYGSWTRVCAAERCPSISRLEPGSEGPAQTSKVYAADGRLIAELGAERRTVLTLSQIPLHVRQAFIATEDKRFYEHHGIDYWRILGALKANIVTLGYSQGFSTITMQLARNIFPDEIRREKTLTRKLKEARVAIEIERNFPKDTILQMYLNQIDLGAGAHGVESAALIYFGKSARDLNLAEAATLAAIPKAPTAYNPRLHPERAVRRRNVVLNLMRDQGYITPEECELWKAYPLVLTTNRTNYGDVAPYFVEMIRQR